MTGYHVHRGALAAMSASRCRTPRNCSPVARRVAVLEAVNDHTNLGVIFRGAAALGMDAVLLSPDCADPLYRRSVKVSMGAVFAVPYARLEGWPGDLDAGRGRASGCGPSPRPEGDALDEAAPHTLEPCRADARRGGRRPDQRRLGAADEWVRIPMAHGVDSLNVGAAAAVAFYAVSTGRPA